MRQSAETPNLPEPAVEHVSAIRDLLGLRGEKSAEQGVFEEAE
jgi:hypothetical protein